MSKQHKQGEHTQHGNHAGQQTWHKEQGKKTHATEKQAHGKKHEHTNDHSWKHESEDLEIEEDD